MIENTTLSKLNISAHRYWTLVTASFSHMGILHLAVNMLSLVIFAPALYKAGGVGIGAYHIIGLTVGTAIFTNVILLTSR